MLYIISYDIPSTPEGQRRRNKIAKALEGVGLRVQYSVFELQIDPTKLPAFLGKLNDLMDAETDSLRVYTCCAACASQTLRLGASAPCEHTELLVW